MKPSVITPESSSYEELLHEDDSSLVRAIGQGNQMALAELEKRYSQDLRGYIYRMGVTSDVEDIVQDVWLRVLQNAGKSEVKSVGGWLLKITRNIVISQWRKNGSRREWEEQQIAQRNRIAGPLQSLLIKERGDIVRHSILDLNPTGRGVVHQRFYEDQRYSEVADSLNIPIGTVRSGLSSAMEKLAADLEGLVTQADLEDIER